MTDEDQIEFHSERAMTELDLALTANSRKAARAHFSLSALHLDRMRDLKDKRAKMEATIGPDR